MWELSILALQLFYKSKNVLQSKIYFLKKVQKIMSESHRGEVGKDEKILLEKKGLLRGSHLLCGGHLNRDLNDINSLKWCLLSALIKEYCCLLINKKKPVL